jgi:hypothetical protein
MDSKPAHDKACRSAFDVHTVAKETAPAKRNPDVTDVAQQGLETYSIVLALNIRPLVRTEFDGHGEAAGRKNRGNRI